MITLPQIRAAKAMLGLTQGQIAQGTGIGMTTMSNILGYKKILKNNIALKLQKFFEKQGVSFASEENEQGELRVHLAWTVPKDFKWL